MTTRTRRSPLAALIAFALSLAACGLPSFSRAAGQPAILLEVRNVIAAVGEAQTVTLSAYTLSARGKMSGALLAAAARGARVSVALDGNAFGAAARSNAKTIAAFRSRGIRVHVTERPLHLKAAVVDGTVFLSDRNWTDGRGREVVIRDPYSGDRLLVERAILGDAGNNDHLWLRKADALAAEAPGPLRSHYQPRRAPDRLRKGLRDDSHSPFAPRDARRSRSQPRRMRVAFVLASGRTAGDFARSPRRHRGRR